MAVGSDHDLRRALGRLAETAASLTGARHAALSLHHEDAGGLGGPITHGVSPGLSRPPEALWRCRSR